MTIASSTYTLRLQDGCAGSVFTTNVENPGSGDPQFTNTAPTGITFTSSASSIVMDALGRALNSSGTVTDVTITVGSRTISIVGETGFVYEN